MEYIYAPVKEAQERYERVKRSHQGDSTVVRPSRKGIQRGSEATEKKNRLVGKHKLQVPGSRLTRNPKEKIGDMQTGAVGRMEKSKCCTKAPGKA